MSIFEYLVSIEKQDKDFNFGVAKGNSLFISYNGYNHANLEKITKHLLTEYKLRYDFGLGIQKFDRVCGKTFTYFKNVYKH